MVSGDRTDGANGLAGSFSSSLEYIRVHFMLTGVMRKSWAMPDTRTSHCRTSKPLAHGSPHCSDSREPRGTSHYYTSTRSTIPPHKLIQMPFLRLHHLCISRESQTSLAAVGDLTLKPPNHNPKLHRIKMRFPILARRSTQRSNSTTTRSHARQARRHNVLVPAAAVRYQREDEDSA